MHDELSHTAHIGVDHIKRFISEFRENPSHQLVSRKVINAMVGEYMKNGISVIVEQNSSRKEIEDLKAIAEAYSADFFVYRLEASEPVLSRRVAERTAKLNKPEIPQADLDEQARIFNENDYPSTRIIDSGNLDTMAQAELVLKDLQVE